MSNIPPLSEGTIEALSRLLGDCATGSDIDRVFADRGLVDESGHSTKWRRLYWVFCDSQRKYHSANQILDFIQVYLTPARFVGRNAEFTGCREKLNHILVLSGLELGADGNFRQLETARTLDEADKRVRTIRTKWSSR